MKAILDEMLAALSRGERVVLSSILASSGSVPRGAGAKMAVFEDDRVLGTIGGGAVERLSIQRAQDALKNGGSNELKSYNLHPSEVASTGMICGGAVTVYFQFFAPEQTADVAVLKLWREMLDKDVDHAITADVGCVGGHVPRVAQVVASLHETTWHESLLLDT